MMKKLLLFLIIGLVQLSFAQNTNLVKAGKEISMSFPSHYVKAYNLNSDAMLQMVSGLQEKFIIVIQDDKEQLKAFHVAFGSLDEAVQMYSKGIIASLGDAKVLPIQKFKIGNYNAAELVFEGISTDDENNSKLNVFYNLTVIETEGYYYQILSWSLKENKQQYMDEFRSITKTFKEL